MRRSIMVLLAAGAVSAYFVLPAAAAPRDTPPYGGVCQIALRSLDGAFKPGSKINVSGSGFDAGNADIVLDSTTILGTAVIGQAGTFSQDVTLPDKLSPGQHKISVACSRTGGDAEATFIVEELVKAFQPPEAPLARTGSNSDVQVMIGTSALLVGAALVMAGGRRRRRVSTA